ncbi:MAG: hypothetical protein ACE5FT_03975 [Candidatus Nanoarchaeia archaeon]
MKFIEDLVKRRRLNKHYRKLLYSFYELCELRLDFAMAKCKKLKIPFYEAMVRFYGFEMSKPKRGHAEWGKLQRKLKKLTLKQVDKKKLLPELYKNSRITYVYLKKEKGCFRWKPRQYDALVATIHFSNEVMPENPFRGEELEKRKREV